MADKHGDASPYDVQPRLLLLQHPAKAATILPLAHRPFHPGFKIRGVFSQGTRRLCLLLSEPILLLLAKEFLLDWHGQFPSISSGHTSTFIMRSRPFA